MRYRKLTADDDYSFGHQQYDFYRDSPEAVAQAVKTRLLLWLREWYLDLEDGTPWLDGILGKGTELTADAFIRSRILDTAGVVEIVEGTYSSTFDRDLRRMSVSCTIDTVYGQAQVAA